MISRIRAELLSDEEAKKLDADATYGVRLSNKNGDERFVSVRFKEIAGLPEDEYPSSVSLEKEALVKMFEGDKKIHEFKRIEFSDNHTFSDVLRMMLLSMDNKSVRKLYDKAFGVIYEAEYKKARLEAKRKEMKAKKEAQEKANAPFNLGCLNFLKGKSK